MGNLIVIPIVLVAICMIYLIRALVQMIKII